MLKTPMVRRDSSYSTARALPPPEEDPDNIELQRHFVRAERELDTEFSALQTQLSQPRDPDSDFVLRRELNKVRERRVAKSVELERLKGLLAAGIEGCEKTHNRFTSEIRDECESQIATLEKDISAAQIQLEAEETQTEILLTLKDRVRATHLIMKDRMLYHQFALRKLTKQHKSSLEAQRIAETCEVLTKLDKSKAKTEFEASASALQHSILENKEYKERVERAKKRTLNRISCARMHSAHRASERENLLTSLKHDVEEFTATRSLVQRKTEMMREWRRKLEVIEKVLERQGVPVPQEGWPQAIVQGYFRMIGTEASLTIQYQNLSQQSEERQSECQVLRSEVAMLNSLYDLSLPWALSHRSELEAQLQSASAKAAIGYMADTNDRFVLEIYTKVSNLVSRCMRRLTFIHDKCINAPAVLCRMIVGLSNSFRKNQGIAKEHTYRTKSLQGGSRMNTGRLSDFGEEVVGLERNFVPGLPLPKAEAAHLLETLFPRLQIEGFIDLFKEVQIPNYFTDMEILRKLAEEKRGVSLPDFFSSLTQSAYTNFMHQVKFVFEANMRLDNEVMRTTTGLRSEVMDFYARNNPDKLRSFDEDFARKLDASSDCYDAKLMRKLKTVSDSRFQHSDSDLPSESLPKLRFFEKSPPKSEHTDTKTLEEDTVELKYLEQSRSEMKIGRNGPIVRTKLKTSHRERKFARFLSRETSPESERMHDLLKGFRKSEARIRRVKMCEVSALSSLPPKLFLIPQSPGSLRRSFLRGYHSKSATASPSASTSAYGFSLLS